MLSRFGKVAALVFPTAIFALSASAATAQQNPAGLAKPGTATIEDRFLPVKPGEVQFTGGLLGARFDASEKHRLLTIDENELLDGFEQRLKPHQDWAGEHVGKWLHAATLVWADTGDKALKAKLDRVVNRLVKTQEPDGYLGTYVPEHRWTSWDVWVHKYDLIGLLTYYQYTGSKPALAACRNVGDLLVRTFGPGLRDINRAGEHMGMAADSVLEPICDLYRATDDPKYLAFGKYIVSNYDAPGGPAILAALEKYHSVKRVANGKAYEMTSNFNGLLELYRITGDPKLLVDTKTAWEDIVKNRLYITGSASSYEVFQDDNQFPNGQRSNICETCVTVTWEQMNLQLLRLTGDSRYAEEVERSVYNHLLAAQNPAGGDWVYYTPLEGHKQYDSFTTCCHSSGPRGIALLPEFAYMADPRDSAVIVNLYNDSRVSMVVPNAGRVTIVQKTGYPVDGKVEFSVDPDRDGTTFALLFRVPAGTTDSSLDVSVNGDRSSKMTLGMDERSTYTGVRRQWRRGDKVTISLSIKPRLILGAHGDEGRAAIVRGPLVLALDAELNPGIGPLNRVALISDDVSKLDVMLDEQKSQPSAPVFSALATVGADPKPVRVYLAPFANAGEDGKSRYTVWIARPGHAAVSTGQDSLFLGGTQSSSRAGNHEGDIADGDPDTYVVTYDNTKQLTAWFAVSRSTPVYVGRVVFMHGHCFHDGGWFDTSKGKPRVEAQIVPGGPWSPLGVLDSYPATTATDSAGLQDGQVFELRLRAQGVYAIRVIGTPATGDNPAQSFTSCAELQGFGQ